MKINCSLVTIFFVSLFLINTAFSADAAAKVKVVTSIPDLAAITEQIGKDKVEVESLAKGYQDPHFVDAKPSYVMKLNRADLLIYNGFDLEIGWLPALITGSRNSKITSPAAMGNLDASRFIPQPLEVPDVPVDRSMGDVHPQGNPHYLLDPRNGIAVARGIADRLGEIDQEHKSFYDSNYQEFENTMRERIGKWEQELSELEGSRVITYHKSWAYLLEWLGVKEEGTLEPKPGIPPSPSHVAGLVKNAKSRNVKLVITANFYPDKTARVVSEKIGVPFISLPAMVGGTEEAETYPDLFNVITERLKGASVE